MPETTIPAAPQPDNFTATFTIKINGIRTATVGQYENVVKQVEWTMVGEEGTQKFELPQTTDLPDPNGQLFIPLQDLTESTVIDWVEINETRLPGIKAHIQYVLDKELAKAQLTATNMPWAPPAPTPEPPVPPTTP
jgi:hypothetical protein